MNAIRTLAFSRLVSRSLHSSASHSAVLPRATTAVPLSKFPQKTPAARASSQADGTGNPEIIESFPTTADEVSVDPELFGGEEGIPAAKVVRQADIVFPPPSSFEGLSDTSPGNWSTSYHGLSSQPFSKDISDILMAPVDPDDIEMKPDGLIYLPEIKYRRILNRAFGPGGWGLAPRTETNVGPKIVSREYALVCLGRLVSIARGEQEYFDPSGIPTATEACKSNALMRCCKDLGIASELWDPKFIRKFKAQYCQEVFVEHIPTKRKRKLWRRKDAKFDYPYKE